jgi:hypothetical protein
MQGPKSGRRKPVRSKPTAESIEHNKHVLYIALTAIILLLALLSVVFGNHGTQLQRCEGVIVGQQKATCLNALAGMTKNASICGQIAYAQLHDSCITGIAESVSNVMLCGQDSSAGYRTACILSISNSTHDAEDCALVGAPYNSTCVYDVESSLGFPSAQGCTPIENATLRHECTYLYDYGYAAASGNAGYCAALPYARNMTLLSAMLTGTNTSSSQLMELSVINATPQNYCYYRLAVQTHNSNLCNDTSGFINQLCEKALSGVVAPPNATANMTNVTACLKVPSDLRVACEYGMLSAEATSSKNISKCMQIANITGSPLYQYSCITTFATHYDEQSYCSYISNSMVEQECVISVENANATT